MTALSNSAIVGQDGAPMQMPLSPQAFFLACREIVANHEGHASHRELDRLVTDLLTSLGYGDGMAIFMREVTPHHSELDTPA